MTSPAPAVELLRRRGVRALALAGWTCLAVLILVGLAVGQDRLPELLAAGALANAGPSWMAWRGRFDAEARAVTGTLAAIMPALLVFQLRGHPWQMDGHMYFFVALAALTMLCDWRPIVLASGLIAAHHLLFEWLVPG